MAKWLRKWFGRRRRQPVVVKVVPLPPMPAPRVDIHVPPVSSAPSVVSVPWSPGDRFIITYPGSISEESAMRMKQAWEQYFIDGEQHQVIVLGEGAQVAVLHRPAEKAKSGQEGPRLPRLKEVMEMRKP